MARKKKEPLYLVERVVWRVHHLRKVSVIPTYLAEMAKASPFAGGQSLPVFVRGEGLIPIKAFRDRVDADQHREEQDATEWVRINPFYYGGGVRDWTSFDEGRLRDWLLDHGLYPPMGVGATKVTLDGWRRWYDQVFDGLDDLQRRAIRQAMDRVVFFQVSELAE